MLQLTKTDFKKRSQTISQMLKKIETTVKAILDVKRRALVINWIFSFCNYLDFETRFDPTRLKKYEPGDIIDVDFGFNLGSELGGVHFAIVLGENSRKNPNIMVVPLCSYESTDEIRENEIDLGFIPELNQYRKNDKIKGTRAIPNQMRIISKMRIYYPKRRTDRLAQVSPEQLQLIQNKIIELYLQPVTSEKKSPETF